MSLIEIIWEYVVVNYYFRLNDGLDGLREWSKSSEAIDLLDNEGTEYTLYKQDIGKYIKEFEDYPSGLKYSFKSNKSTKYINGNNYSLEDYVLRKMIKNINVKYFEDQNREMQDWIREYLVENDIWKEVRFLGRYYDLDSSYGRKLLHQDISNVYYHSIYAEKDNEGNLLYYRTSNKYEDSSYKDYLDGVKKRLKFKSEYDKDNFDIVAEVRKVDYKIVEKELERLHKIISDKNAKALKKYEFKYFQIDFE